MNSAKPERLNELTVREISQSREEPEWVLKKRLEAFKIFEKSSMPDMRYGLDIKMDLLGLDLNSINPLVSSDIENQKRNDITIKPLSRAIIEDADVLKKFFMKTASFSDKISAMHWAFWNRGLFVHVPSGANVSEPISISLESNGHTIENILIVMEPNSGMNFLETLSGEPTFRSGFTEAFLGEGSSLKFGSIQKYGQGTYNFSDKRAVIGKDSKMDWVTFDLGSFRTLSDIRTQLAGPGSEAKTLGMFFGNQSQQFNFYVNSTHASPDATSLIVTKGALNDKAKAIYRGLVKIDPLAARSNGYQIEETLLLSDEAEIDPVPNLEIENNDVRCTHGTTVSHIDPDRIFYLMSRGISELDAKKKLVEGFFENVIQTIPTREIESDVRHLLSRKVEEIK